MQAREPNLQSRGDAGLGGHLQQPQRGYKRRMAAKMGEEPWRQGSTCRIGMGVVGDLVFFLNVPFFPLGTCCFIKKKSKVKIALLDLSLE